MKTRYVVGCILLVGIVAILFTAYPAWRKASDNGGQQPAKPFNIAGNLYYVGANDVTAFLLVDDSGHVLIDGGYPGTASMILNSVRELGFSPRDIKWQLNTHAHLDHAGGLAEIQSHTGATVLASYISSQILRRGGQSDTMLGPLSFLTHLPFLQYPPVTGVQAFSDNKVLELGSHRLTPVSTPGHIPGCTSWYFPVTDRGVQHQVLLSCGLSPPLTLTLFKDKNTIEAFEKSFQQLEALDVDIFLTPHARTFGRWKKYQQNLQNLSEPNAFIDRPGWQQYLKSARQRVDEAAR